MNFVAGLIAFAIFFVVTYAVLELLTARRVGYLTHSKTLRVIEDASVGAIPLHTRHNQSNYYMTSETVNANMDRDFTALAMQLKSIEDRLNNVQPQSINYYVTNQNMERKEEVPVQTIESFADVKEIMEEQIVATIPEVEVEHKETVRETVLVKDYTPFLTRKEVGERYASLGNPNIVVSQYRMESQIPMSLKWKTNTFALMYADDEGLLAVVALSEDQAKELAATNPDIHRPKFPKGQNWFAFKVNHKTFESTDAVYKVLDMACEFVEEKYAKKEIELAVKRIESSSNKAKNQKVESKENIIEKENNMVEISLGVDQKIRVE